VLHLETGRHRYGGAQQVLYLLAGLAAEAGDEHHLACPPDAAVGREAPDGVTVHLLPQSGDLDPRFVWGLWRLLRRLRPDLVHVHSRRGADVWGGLLARLAGVPAVVSRRVDNPEPRWVARLKYRPYARVITISEGIRQVLLGEGVPADRVVCVPSAVDVARYQGGCDRAGLEAEFGLDAGAVPVAMAAQFIERKGHRDLLAAWPAVVAAEPRARLLLFGQGPLRGEMEARAAELGITDTVVFAGFRDDLHRFLPCLRALAHPARMEGLGVTLLQAGAAGVPIVACPVGGIPEIVRDGETGYRVPPEDPEALAAALQRLVGDAERARALGAAARAHVEAHFTIPAMVAGNRRVYEAVLGDNR
jgi:glycosyltransferase involved in cell wall biosynthesis